jgi:hypothetical protein
MKIRSLLVVSCLCWVVPVDSGALTVQEIVLLKQNGVSEQTIQMMLQSEMRAGADPLAGKKPWASKPLRGRTAGPRLSIPPAPAIKNP